MAEIGNLDGWLLELMDGQPPVARRYELRCHPDVFLALRRAGDDRAAREYLPSALPNAGTPGVYGSADVVVRVELGSGGWELYEAGELIKSGRLRSGLQSGSDRNQSEGQHDPG